MFLGKQVQAVGSGKTSLKWHLSRDLKEKRKCHRHLREEPFRLRAGGGACWSVQVTWRGHMAQQREPGRKPGLLVPTGSGACTLDFVDRRPAAPPCRSRSTLPPSQQVSSKMWLKTSSYFCHICLALLVSHHLLNLHASHSLPSTHVSCSHLFRADTKSGAPRTGTTPL